MKHAPSLAAQRNDIQAVLASGFGWLRCSRFWLMTVHDAALAKAWLGDLEQTGLIQSVDGVARQKDETGERPAALAAIAFSFAGLRRLGLAESGEFPFPTAFRSGMGSDLRKELLRDGDRSAWRWSDHETQPASPEDDRVRAHILLALWWRDGPAPELPPRPAGAFSIGEIEACPSFFRQDGATGKHLLYEAFRFRDGISQPVPYGLRSDIDAPRPLPASPEKVKEERDQVVAAGEFILGYRNEYDELSYCPDVAGWRAAGDETTSGAHFALNGSYLAVRQIDQDLAALARLEALETPRCPAGATLAEAMMGRRRDGSPLDLPATPPDLAGDEPNSFRYRVTDENGFVTARGSHIRRANPRDTLGHDVPSGILSSKLHRLLRRGRPYRLDDGAGATVAAGLFFIACNTDLERQFEFVHQRWLCNPRFGDLEDEDDPFVGAASPQKKFTMPGLPSGTSVSFGSVTTTVGGGYFFLPGLKALRFIATAPVATVPERP